MKYLLILLLLVSCGYNAKHHQQVLQDPHTKKIYKLVIDYNFAEINPSYQLLPYYDSLQIYKRDSVTYDTVHISGWGKPE